MALQQQRVRGLIAALAALGCAGEAPPAAVELQRYLEEPASRRSALERSLVRRDNGYARLRLRHYESGDVADWSRLPVWNPPTARAGADGAPLGAPRRMELTAAHAGGDRAALLALGAAAFWTYPAQLASSSVERAVLGGEDLSRYGFLREGTEVTGLLRVALPDGSLGVALSCAACHVSRRGGALVAGLANERLNLGALAARDLPDGALADRLRAWGPGRVDVSTDDGREPAAIPDLRPVRWQTHLQRAGAVVMLGEAALAVRTETLLITSLHGAVRPPREVVAGLTLYLLSLGDTLPQRPMDTAGQRVFGAECARCHAGEGMSGGLVALSEVGTDGALANSLDRGTGAYRVPSLRGVGARGALLHDGSVADVDALLDPARAAPGHRYGLTLGATDRAALQVFLRSL